MGFQVGQVVRLKADSSREGSIIALLTPLAGVPRYKVFHSARDTRDYSEDQLVPVDEEILEHDVIAAINRKEWLDIDSFKARLTSARLANPQLDSIYALHAARIKFNAFQFKPLLRFLKADAPRLLIADEVGVGKTIEAGLILKELSARQKLKNVLIVCPKALTTKWRSEMRRFDEDFKVLTSDNLGYCLRETELDGEWPFEYSRSIVHLELLRLNDYTEGTKSKPGFFSLVHPPQFSLMIFDEAHHARTTNTNSHRIIRFLAECSESVVFLSATPVHVGSENLYALLSLIRPDVFLDADVFNEMVEPNKHILQAMRSIRAASNETPWTDEAALALSTAASTTWGSRTLAHDPRFTDCVQLLKSGSVDNLSRVRCLRDLEELHTLSMVMNRTRRRDIGQFTVRDPHTISVGFTPPQEELYNAVIEFRRSVLLLDYDPLTVGLVTDTLQRQAASCLPALAPAIDSFLRTGRFQFKSLTDSDDSESSESTSPLPSSLLQEAQRIRQLAKDLPAQDPKADALLELTKTALETEGPRKVLIFSLFLHTLEYLRRTLSTAGYRVAVVNGSVPDEDRDRLRERFRKPHNDADALDVLLSSEVGCEGLDYEFCDVLVNYDIPWNPMRLEQRIGRVDRYGQKSPKVRIYNFVTPNTVEERIFYRCYERLGIFSNTIGDLEEILGDLIHELNRAAMDASLSEAEAELIAQQAVDNALRKVEEEKRLENESAQLLGLDDLLMQDISSMSKQGRLVSGKDLQQLVGNFLSSPAIGGRITPVPSNPLSCKLSLPDVGKRALLSSIQKLGEGTRHIREFVRWLENSDSELLVTFDQDTAFENRSLPFITAIHPLVRLAVAEWASSRIPLLVKGSVQADRSIPEGVYVFTCYLWEYIGLRPDLRLLGFAYDPATQSTSESLSEALVKLLTDLSPPHKEPIMGATDIEKALHVLDDMAERRRQAELIGLVKTNHNLREFQLATLSSYYQNRLSRIAVELNSSTNARIQKMKDSELKRVEREFEDKRIRLERTIDGDIVTRRLAAGVLEVRHDR